MHLMLDAMLGAYAWRIAPGYARHAMHVRTYVLTQQLLTLGRKLTLGNARTRIAKISQSGMNR